MVRMVWSSTVFSRITRAVAATGHRVSSHPYLAQGVTKYYLVSTTTHQSVM